MLIQVGISDSVFMKEILLLGKAWNGSTHSLWVHLMGAPFLNVCVLVGRLLGGAQDQKQVSVSGTNYSHLRTKDWGGKTLSCSDLQ